MQRVVPVKWRDDVAVLRRQREIGESAEAVAAWPTDRLQDASEWLALDEAQRRDAGCSGPCGMEWPAVALDWVPVPGARDEHVVLCANCQRTTADQLGVSLS
jgi:hypothetical protein